MDWGRGRGVSVDRLEYLNTVAVCEIDRNPVHSGKPPAFNSLLVSLVFQRFALTVGYLDINNLVLILPVQHKDQCRDSNYQSQ